MVDRLGRRVINFANLPIKILMPTTYTNIYEIALKTIPSASKIEIKRPEYKKAYITLRNPLSISPNLFPIRVIEEERTIEVSGDGGHGWRGGRGDVVAEKAKFPWSSMRSATANSSWCCFLDFLFFN
ncbi:hypothetical protein Peur_066637 [Populus x canadensis]